MRLQEPLSPEASYELGKELFELWVNLGTVSRMNLEYRRRHTEKEWVQDAVQSRRAKHWWVENAVEGIEINLKHNPSMPLWILEQKVLGYALVILVRKDQFSLWLEKNPWAEKYEEIYSAYYVE